MCVRLCSGTYRAIATKAMDFVVDKKNLIGVMTSATVLCLQTENEDCRQRGEISMPTGIVLDLLWSKTTQKPIPLNLFVKQVRGKQKRITKYIQTELKSFFCRTKINVS